MTAQTMTKTPLELLTPYYDGLINDRPGSREYARSLWDPDATLTFAGNHAFSGTHPATRWHREFYKPALRAAGIVDRKVACLSLVGDDRFGVSHYIEAFVRDAGGRLDADRFCIYGFAHDRIVSMRVIDSDPDSVDAFFTQHVRPPTA